MGKSGCLVHYSADNKHAHLTGASNCGGLDLMLDCLVGLWTCLVSAVPKKNKISSCFGGQTYVQLTNVQLTALMVPLLLTSGQNHICSIYQLGLSNRTDRGTFLLRRIFFPTRMFTPQENLRLEKQENFSKNDKKKQELCYDESCTSSQSCFRGENELQILSNWI